VCTRVLHGLGWPLARDRAWTRNCVPRRHPPRLVPHPHRRLPQPQAGDPPARATATGPPPPGSTPCAAHEEIPARTTFAPLPPLRLQARSCCGRRPTTPKSWPSAATAAGRSCPTRTRWTRMSGRCGGCECCPFHCPAPSPAPTEQIAPPFLADSGAFQTAMRSRSRNFGACGTASDRIASGRFGDGRVLFRQQKMRHGFALVSVCLGLR
jgi:hypothetical protein